MMALPFAFAATVAAGLLRARVEVAIETGSGGAPAATYHGTIVAVVTDTGQVIELDRRALGSDTAGLVTAASRADLRAGRFDPGLTGRRVRLRSVWYDRARAGYPSRQWEHDLKDTDAVINGGRVAFLTRAGGRPASVCSMPGDFICKG